MKRILAAAVLTTFLGCGSDRSEPHQTPPPEEAPPQEGEIDDDQGGNLTPPADPVDVPDPDNDAVSHFRGVVRINEILHERIVEDDDMSQYFFVGGYLGGYSPDFLYGLPTLLGFVESDGINAEFRNGEANAINIVLWNLTFSSLGNDIAKHCSPDAHDYIPFQLRADLASTIAELCLWPESRSEETIESFWRVVMRHDAPAGETDAFTSFFMSEAYSEASGPDLIRDMTTAAMMNPYFLIQQ